MKSMMHLGGKQHWVPTKWIFVDSYSKDDKIHRYWSVC